MPTDYSYSINFRLLTFDKPSRPRLRPFFNFELVLVFLVAWVCSSKNWVEAQNLPEKQLQESAPRFPATPASTPLTNGLSDPNRTATSDRDRWAALRLQFHPGQELIYRLITEKEISSTPPVPLSARDASTSAPTDAESERRLRLRSEWVVAESVLAATAQHTELAFQIVLIRTSGMQQTGSQPQQWGFDSQPATTSPASPAAAPDPHAEWLSRLIGSTFRGRFTPPNQFSNLTFAADAQHVLSPDAVLFAQSQLDQFLRLQTCWLPTEAATQNSNLLQWESQEKLQLPTLAMTRRSRWQLLPVNHSKQANALGHLPSNQWQFSVHVDLLQIPGEANSLPARDGIQTRLRQATPGNGTAIFDAATGQLQQLNLQTAFTLDWHDGKQRWQEHVRGHSLLELLQAPPNNTKSAAPALTPTAN